MGEAILTKNGGMSVYTKVEFNNYLPSEMSASQGVRTTLASLTEARYEHRAVSIGNGSVMFVSGLNANGSNVRTINSYTPGGILSTFTGGGTYQPGTATDGNGNALIGGGSKSTSVIKYDKNAVQSTLTPFTYNRDHLAAAADKNGSVIFGGGHGNVNLTNGVTDYVGWVERYSKTGIKSTLENLLTSRKDLVGTSNGSGGVLFGGGQTGGPTYHSRVDHYDIDGVRSNYASLSNTASLLAAAADRQGNSLFGGGYYNSKATIYPLKAVDCFSRSGIRTTYPNLSEERYELAAATDGNGNVLFGGGRSGGSATYACSTVDCYYPNGDYKSLSSLSLARCALAAAADGNGNVLFGGGNGKNGVSDVVNRYSSGMNYIIVPAPVGSKYNFDGTERVSTKNEIQVKVPATGYIKYKSGKI